MSFILKKSLTTKDDRTKEFSHDETGLKLTLRSINTPAFQKANAIIGRKDLAEKGQALTQELLSKERVTDDMLTFDEALIYAFGEHIITDWNVADEDGEVVEVGGDAFVKVVSAVDDPFNLLMWCLDKAKEVAKEAHEELESAKKKPSKGGTGKGSIVD